MSANRLLAAEFVVAIGFSSWSAIKSRQMPWPPTVVRTAIAFGILYILAQASPELATVLGGGFLLAQLVKVLENKAPYTGGTPELHQSTNQSGTHPGIDNLGSMPGDTKHTFGVLAF